MTDVVIVTCTRCLHAFEVDKRNGSGTRCTNCGHKHGNAAVLDAQIAAQYNPRATPRLPFGGAAKRVPQTPRGRRAR